MRWDQLNFNLFAAVSGALVFAITYQNWRRGRKGTELWHVCAIGGAAAGMVSQAAFQVAHQALDMGLTGGALLWLHAVVAGTPIVAGLVTGLVLERRLRRRQAPQTEQDYIDPEV